MKTINSFVKTGLYFTILFLIAVDRSNGQQNNILSYEIVTTWNNESISNNEMVNISFSRTPPEAPQKGLVIEMSAPFYNENVEKDLGVPGRVEDGLECQNIQILFLGPKAHYLELEFGPGGHYFVVAFAGMNNVVTSDWTLSDYKAAINDSTHTWGGRAVIPEDYFPPKVDHFNAYATHGINDSRKVLALFPVPFNSSKVADVHNLDSFEPIDLSDFINIQNITVRSIEFSSGNVVVSSWGIGLFCFTAFIFSF